MSKLNDIFKLLAYSVNCTLNDWSGISNIIKADMAEKFLPINTIFSDTFTAGDNNTRACPIQVAHIYDNGNVAFKFKYAYSTAINFDMPEAIYYGALDTGDYYIEIGETMTGINSQWTAGNYIKLSINKNQNETVADTDQLVVKKQSGNLSVTDSPATCDWIIYPKGSTIPRNISITATVSDSVPENTTPLGTIKLNNAATNIPATDTTPNHLNCLNRVFYGYNNYSEGVIRQFLNNDLISWWAPLNPWDRPPTNFSNLSNFLSMISNELRDIVEESNIIINKLNSGAIITENIIKDKFFIPSITEMYYNPITINNTQFTDGEAWDYYKQLAQQSLPSDLDNGKFTSGKAYSQLRISHITNTAGSISYWQRSIKTSNIHQCSVFASSNDQFTNISASQSSYVLPCFIIHKSFLT